MIQLQYEDSGLIFSPFRRQKHKYMENKCICLQTEGSAVEHNLGKFNAVISYVQWRAGSPSLWGCLRRKQLEVKINAGIILEWEQAPYPSLNHIFFRESEMCWHSGVLEAQTLVLKPNKLKEIISTSFRRFFQKIHPKFGASSELFIALEKILGIMCPPLTVQWGKMKPPPPRDLFPFFLPITAARANPKITQNLWIPQKKLIPSGSVSFSVYCLLQFGLLICFCKRWIWFPAVNECLTVGRLQAWLA